MGTRGRPAMGPALVERLDGSTLAKERLEVILETLGGRASIQHACERLGVGRTAFHKMRSRFLAEAAALLEPRPVGRRPKTVTPEQALARDLRLQNEQLKRDLKTQQVREEIAVVMPFLLRREGSRPPKTTRRTPAQRRTPSRPTPGASGSTRK